MLQTLGFLETKNCPGVQRCRGFSPEAPVCHPVTFLSSWGKWGVDSYNLRLTMKVNRVLVGSLWRAAGLLPPRALHPRFCSVLGSIWSKEKKRVGAFWTFGGLER